MCYTVPLTATIILNALWKTKKIQNHHLDQLNLLLLGGTVMLVVDHLWNKEIFFAGENILKDLMLGVVMTGVVFVVWGLLVLKEKKTVKVILRDN